MEIPKELYGLCPVVKDDMLHCVGGVKDKVGNTDLHFSIKLEKIYIKNGGLIIFENWFRAYGFKESSKDLGQIVEDYAGNIR